MIQNSVLLSLAEQINLMLFYVQDVYKKNQLATRLEKSKESGVMTQGRREVEVGTLLLRNDKTILLLIKSKLFLVFKFQVEVYHARFETK